MNCEEKEIKAMPGAIILLVISIILFVKFHWYRVLVSVSSHVILLLLVIEGVVYGLDYLIHTHLGIEPFGQGGIIGVLLYESFSPRFDDFTWFLKVIKDIALIDISISVASIADVLITILTFSSRKFLRIRYPLFITIIIMLKQIQTRKKTSFYCPVCQKNQGFGDITGICLYCDSDVKIKLMNITGFIDYRCTGRFGEKKQYRCDKRFRRISPFNQKLMQNRAIACKNCHTVLKTGNVVNLMLYTDKKEMASAYRECFVGRYFDRFNPNSIGVYYEDKKMLDKIIAHYKGVSWSVSYGMTLKEMELHPMTGLTDVNDVAYKMRIAIANDEEYQLLSSEGIIVLIDGKYDSVKKQNVIDDFLLSLNQIKVNSSKWDKPVLIGLCANGVKELEERIGQKFTSSKELEEYCINYLNDNGNSEIKITLENDLSNIHFFLYRTGCVREHTEDKIFNVMQPVYSVMSKYNKKLNLVWNPDINGYCLDLSGAK